jgi:gliding-associated putative ABC transporter substrate-binding component GldG
MLNKKLGNIAYDWTVFIGLAAILVFINLISAFFFYRWDLTEDKRYSLTEQTKAFLKNKKNFPEPVFIKVYLDGDLPADIKMIRNAIEDKLRDFKIYAGSRLEYEFINPNEGTEEDIQELGRILYNKGNGIRPTDLTIQSVNETKSTVIWPGAEISYQGEVKGYVQFFNRTRLHSNENFKPVAEGAINNIEYNLLNGIRLAVAEKKQRIGFLHGHGEWEEKQMLGFRNMLKKNYILKDVIIDGYIHALDELDGLIIAGPNEPFSEKDLYVIDQFVMRGGRLMCFIDPVFVDRDTLFRKGATQAVAKPLKINDNLYRYGMRLNTDLIVDGQCAPEYIPGHPQKVMPWIFFPIASGTEHPISRNIDPVVLRYASSIDFVGLDTNKRIPLLVSSGNTGIRRAPCRVDYRFVNLPAEFTTDPDDPRNKVMFAGIVEGYFKSSFRNQIIAPEFKNNPDANVLEESTKPSKILLVGDADLVTNRYDSLYSKESGKWEYRPKPFDEFKFEPLDPNILSGKQMPLFIYGNAEFLLNAIDYAMGDESVLGVRARRITIKPLNEQKIANHARFWQLINVALPVLMIILIGLLMAFLRKRKYSN